MKYFAKSDIKTSKGIIIEGDEVNLPKDEMNALIEAGAISTDEQTEPVDNETMNGPAEVSNISTPIIGTDKNFAGTDTSKDFDKSVGAGSAQEVKTDDATDITPKTDEQSQDLGAGL